MDSKPNPKQVAVLVSGGIDSAVLCADMASRYERIHPVYIRFGLQWEDVELAWLESFFAAADCPRIAALTVLEEPMAGIYGRHWSTQGGAVPDADSPDDAVYLPGRNLMLLTKAAVWCRLHGIDTIMLGSLGGNPFCDSTPEFDRAMEKVLERGLDARITIERPYMALTKSDVLRRGSGLPLELTFSCIRPEKNHHCGHCNKCAERQRAFRRAGISDKTPYAVPLAS